MIHVFPLHGDAQRVQMPMKRLAQRRAPDFREARVVGDFLRAFQLTGNLRRAQKHQRAVSLPDVDGRGDARRAGADDCDVQHIEISFRQRRTNEVADRRIVR